MSESFVDLLLVRLGREEEKRKVLKLLITNLDLSVTDAENAVSNSPSVIKEAVPMSEARIIQKDLYPYIDLLPRLEDEADPASDGETEEINDFPSDFDDTKVDSETDDSDDLEHGSSLIQDKPEDESQDEADDEDEDEDEEEGEGEDDSSVLITSASEEIITTSRCHICGRTPVDGERLAPCRTCGDLTCRNCFDRAAHVCSHCASEGKTIDRANAGIESENKGLEFDADEPADDGRSKGSNVLRIIAIVFLVLVTLAAGFYFIDPLDMFAPFEDVDMVFSDQQTEADSSNAIAGDTSSVESNGSLEQDTTSLVDTIPGSLGAPEDSLLLLEDPFSISALGLPDSSVFENPPTITYRTRIPSSVDAEIYLDESEILFSYLESIAASVPLVVDDAAFLVYHDTTSVFVMSILHPEETGRRLALMRKVASWLASSNIDQLVLVYRENRFQDPVHYSLVSEAFLEVEGVLNPTQFQSLLGYREDCRESISGPVVQWLSNIE